ncbi:MAG: PHP domain-containing protein [Epulopiscium sp.]|nr:PHP domain-containing protein [Candidatus Epulonipiscium sp.]
MKYAYDLHIHTALSPCGDKNMTPNNIVNMSLLKELDIIAITDHNSCENAETVMRVAKGSHLMVLPGMEIETSEEVHMVCLFPDMDAANKMQEIVYNSLPPLKNRADIFGNQFILDENDDIIRENDRLLLTATTLNIYEVVSFVKKLKGVTYPAHIDRNSYSIVSNLGWIPKDLEIGAIEISRNADSDKIISKYNELKVIKSSDAHYLEDIFEREQYLELPIKSIPELIKLLS